MVLWKYAKSDSWYESYGIMCIKIILPVINRLFFSFYLFGLNLATNPIKLLTNEIGAIHK